jgi:predicted MFS family arabinose efflux permease
MSIDLGYFTLTLAYLGEQCSAMDAGDAFAGYITGNVASNLVGRLISATVAESLGLATNFYFFALLNLTGALLVYFTIKRVQPIHSAGPAQSPLSAMMEHWRDPALRAAFGAGFCILFAFIGTFTYVNFVLVRAPLSLGMMGVGFVYFVFLPSILTTLLAGKAVALFGMRPPLWGGLVIAALGLPLMLSSHLADVLARMVLAGIGTFLAQAFVGQAARANRGVASGTYLACYFFGGLVGSAALGQLFDHFGWPACVAGVGAALAAACFLTGKLELAGSAGLITDHATAKPSGPGHP